MHKKKIKIQIEPVGKRLILNEPKNAIKAIKDGGIDIKSVCGGKGTCGKCRIIILNDRALPPGKQEQKILSTDEIKKGVRLACQQNFKEDLTIYIPASSLSEEQKLQITGIEDKIKVDPVVRKYFLKLKKATLEDIKSDYDRIRDSLRKEYKVVIDNIDYEVLKSMPYIIRKNLWEITVTVRDNEIIFIEGKDNTDNSYGIAVDLGTTKIAVFLVDLLTGKTIDAKGVVNPQISFGEDVMSRLNFAMQGKENQKIIQEIAIKAINDTVEKLCKNNNIKSEQITEMTLVGNTAMHHLFLLIPVSQLGLSPFVPAAGKSLNLKAREVGIKISPGAYIYMLPPIAGFVGSDHLGMILATNLYFKKGNCIGIDIGTNTEIALKTKKYIYSVSTASGPAFEGAHIKYGMRAAPGAIERVVIDTSSCIPEIQTINDREPVGICGSGILDSIAELLRAEIIDRKGKFKAEKECICKDKKGNLQYVLIPSFYNGKKNLKENDKISKKNKFKACGDEYISINQKDIVEIQLAKGAIRTGAEILLKNCKLSFKEINKIIISGAFGSYIDPKNAINIGMFPNFSLKNISQVGNAAGVGAKMVLVSKAKRKIAEKLSSKIKYLELTVFPGFSSQFAESLLFPDPDRII